MTISDELFIQWIWRGGSCYTCTSTSFNYEEEKRKGERKGKGERKQGRKRKRKGSQPWVRYICIFHVVYRNTFLSRPLFIFTFRETTYNWSTDQEDIEVSPFTQKVGPAVFFSASVLEIFRLFFTTSLVATIVGETNRYAREVLGESAGAKWEDVAEEDVWTFLGFVLLMGSYHSYSYTGAPTCTISKANYTGSLFGHMKISSLLQKCTFTSSKHVICNGCVMCRVMFHFVHSIRSPMSHLLTLDSPASNIGRCGCLLCQLPASSGAVERWCNGGFRLATILLT